MKNNRAFGGAKIPLGSPFDHFNFVAASMSTTKKGPVYVYVEERAGFFGKKRFARHLLLSSAT